MKTENEILKSSKSGRKRASGPAQGLSEDDISDLPALAQTAFAARCARRVQPLYRLWQPDGGWPLMETFVELAIASAELHANGHKSTIDGRAAAFAAAMMNEQTQEPLNSVSFTAWCASASVAKHHRPNAVEAAKLAATCSLQHVWMLKGNLDGAEPIVCAKAHPEVTAATLDKFNRYLDIMGREEGAAPISRDFRILQSFVDKHECDDSTPFPSDLFGPLWPDGEPQWLGDLRRKAAIELRIVVDNGNDVRNRKPNLAREFKVTAMEEEEEGIARVRRSINDALAGASNDYVGLRDSLSAIVIGMREEVAQLLEPALNDYVKTLPQATYEEKKQLAKWVNAEMREFGLALKAPGIKEPCFLVAHPGNHPEIGRFQLDYTDENRRHHRTLHSVKLPQLELMLDDLTRAPYPNQTRRR